jgi:hypothetical protein
MKMKLLSRLVALAVAVSAAGAGYAASIVITSPTAGETVSGIVEVRATVTVAPGETATAPVVQTIAGTQVPMLPAPEGAGVQVARVDTSTLPNGRQALVVFLTPKGRDARREEYADESWGEDREVSRAELPIVVRNPYSFYWGDIHAHTSYSDGGWYPNEAYRYARDTAKLDFFAVTDHEEILTEDEFADVVTQANGADAPGRFVALYGVERSNGETGHVCYYMSPARLLPTDLTTFYRAMEVQGLLGHFNHPWPNGAESGWRNDFQDFRYSPEGDRSMAMVEVRDPGEEACYIAMLNNGWHVGAAGDKDAHAADWGQGPTWTVVLAKELTREGILEAMRARRTYSAADRNMKLEFTLDGEDMGARVSRPAGRYEFSIAVDDPDEADLVESVDVFLDGKIATSMTRMDVAPSATRTFALSGPLTLTPGNHSCFVRVTQAEGKTTWSSPIWVSAYEYVPLPMKKPEA